MVRFIRNNEAVEAQKIDLEKINALDSTVRLKILEFIEQKSFYPAKIAEKLDLDKQKVYYHIDILKEAEIIEIDRKEERSGGLASYYKPKNGGLVYDLGGNGEKISFGDDLNTRNLLKPLIKDANLNGYIAVGSPDKHGSDNVRARDGHLAGEIGLKLGEYCKNIGKGVKLDTDIKREDLFDQNLIIIGGILTNSVAKNFNDEFQVNFEGKNFPYRKMDTPNSEYSEPDIGVIAKTKNPEDADKSIFIVAGIRNRGTVAAVEAFKDIEKILDQKPGKEFYCIVKGLDLDGDGYIDDFEVLEKM